MADAIKRFFEKRKRDLVFKTAGAGHKLTDDTRSVAASSGGRSTSGSGASATGGVPILERHVGEISMEQRMAAEAALARTAQVKPGSASGSSGTANMAAMKQKILAEQKQMDKAVKDAARYAEGPRTVVLETSPVVSGAFFHCSFVGDDVILPREEMEKRIEETLYAQVTEEPAIISSLMIHTLNIKVEECVATISSIIDNILKNPDVEKYRRMKCSGKTLNEKVLSLKGTTEFLQAVGFQRKLVPGQDGGEAEDCLVFDSSSQDNLDRLRSGKEILLEVKPIRPVLARCTKTFRIGEKSTAPTSIQVPSDFYAVSPEELQREAKIRAEAVEEFGMLRTKQMREHDRARELRRYRFCLIRVRFPDHTLAQATFGSSERLLAVKEWLGREVLKHDWIPYTLTVTGGKRVEGQETSTMAELDLAPACVLNFAYDTSVVADMVQSDSLGKDSLSPMKDGYVKHELMVDSEYM